MESVPAYRKDFWNSFGKQMQIFSVCRKQSCRAGQIELDLEGYEQYWNYAVKKGYSGTAVFTKKKPLNVTYGIGIEEHDQEGRVITLEFEEFLFCDCVHAEFSERACQTGLPHEVGI